MINYNITFGTDGWRGIIDKEITNKTMAVAAQAFADYLNINTDDDQIKTVIGHDGRLHSKPFALLFARILSGNNITAFLSDKIIPTPILSYYVKENRLNAGVMITASHNPANYGGIKFKASYGGPLFSEETKKVEELIGKELVQADDEKIYQVDITSTYLQNIKKIIDFESIRKSGLNILIDSMAGAGQQIIENLLIEKNIKAKTIYKIAEKDFAGRISEPVEKNLQPLREELEKDDYSLGIATDGDADRMGVMMGNGEYLSSQEIILLLADYLFNQKKINGHIVKTSAVTDKLRHFFETDIRKVFEVQVGFKYVCEKMLSENIAFGCEESGGYGYKDHIPERDGILSGLFIIEMLAKSGFKNLNQYVQSKRKEFGKIFYNRIDLPLEANDLAEKMNVLLKNPPGKISNFTMMSFHDYFNDKGNINGVKFSLKGNNRWLLIRSSETEPLIRIYAEGKSDVEVNNLLVACKNLFKLNL